MSYEMRYLLQISEENFTNNLYLRKIIDAKIHLREL